MNKRKLTDYSVLAPDTPTKLKRQQKNLLGYLKYCYIGHSEYRHNNDDWFYVSNTELLKETGIGSKQTLYVYLNLFIEDGIIEKLTGDRHHANLYRFTSNYTDHRHDYKPIQNRTTRQTDNEQINEKSVLLNEVESVLPDFEQNRTTDKDTDKEKECTYNVCSYSSSITSGISTFSDESETDTIEQQLTMEEQMNDTKWDEKKFQEMNERKKTIMASIEKFIAASPTLTDDKVKEYIELYSTKLREVYYRQDYASNAIATMVSRISKARTPKCTPVETEQKQKVKINKPLDWMLENLPQPSIDNIVDDITLYCQYACDYLHREYSNPAYRHKVDSHKYWYLDNLFSNYAPVLVEHVSKYRGNEWTIGQAEDCICHIWMKHCSSFPI